MDLLRDGKPAQADNATTAMSTSAFRGVLRLFQFMYVRGA